MLEKPEKSRNDPSPFFIDPPEPQDAEKIKEETKMTFVKKTFAATAAIAIAAGSAFAAGDDSGDTLGTNVDPAMVDGSGTQVVVKSDYADQGDNGATLNTTDYRTVAVFEGDETYVDKGDNGYTMGASVMKDATQHSNSAYIGDEIKTTDGQPLGTITQVWEGKDGEWMFVATMDDGSEVIIRPTSIQGEDGPMTLDLTAVEFKEMLDMS